MLRWIAHLMVVMLLWQMGACPCGCPQHHVWLETLVGHDAGAPLDHAVADGAASEGLAFDDTHGHCQGSGRASYIRAPELRPGLIVWRLPAGEAVAGQSIAIAPSPHSRRLCTSICGVSVSRWGPATARAALMVWHN